MNQQTMSQRLRSVAVTGIVLGLIAVAAVTLWIRRPAGAEHPPEYVAMGDSVSVGVGASDPDTTGFVALFRQTVAAELTPGQTDEASGAQTNGAYLKLENIAVGGETSATLIADGQLNEALALLAERNQNSSEVDDVEVITLSVGGNDLKPLFETCPAIPQADCIAQAQVVLGTYAANLGQILGGIRTAAGPDTRILVMNYYNPVLNPGCPLSAYAPLADQIVQSLNGTIVAVSAAVPGIEVVDVYSAGLGPNDLQPDCLHPDDSGHALIAQAFATEFTN
jgi:lysophospholipase L1-like esterase